MKTLDDIQYECTRNELGVSRAWLEKVMAASDAEVMSGIADGRAVVAKVDDHNKARAEKIVRALEIVAAARGLVN